MEDVYTVVIDSKSGAFFKRFLDPEYRLVFDVREAKLFKDTAEAAEYMTSIDYPKAFTFREVIC